VEEIMGWLIVIGMGSLIAGIVIGLARRPRGITDPAWTAGAAGYRLEDAKCQGPPEAHTYSSFKSI
jgi:hypothetical protein